MNDEYSDHQIKIGPRTESEEKDHEIRCLKDQLACMEREIKSHQHTIYILKAALRAVL